MSRLALLIAFILSTQLHAANFGKFRMKIKADYLDASEVIFLLNSAGQVETLENDDYFEIDSLPFFGELTLNFKSGDEDLLLTSFTLRDNQVLSACAALVDQPNEVLSLYPSGHATLQRWNTKTKRFEDINSLDLESRTDQCEQELIKDYAHFEEF